MNYELMFDLETLDTLPSAVVLSVGAVVWKNIHHESSVLNEHQPGTLEWEPVDRFYRILNIQEQLDKKRTVSQSTLLWWLQQDKTALQEAFSPVRQPVNSVLTSLNDWVTGGQYDISAFWASPATFDFPIWEDLAMTFSSHVPWTYRQKYDVRTVVREANYSAKDHVLPKELAGMPHMPVFDCEAQIDVLTAARVKAGRRAG